MCKAGHLPLVCANRRRKNIFRAAILCACGQKLSARHIFYVAPFRSIIGQNVQEFKKALGGSEYLLEHHTDAVLDTENPEILRQLERWQEAPVICTTMVQMLQTLFCSRRQNVRRMAALANSILVFDEIQSLPICHTYIIQKKINPAVALRKESVDRNVS